MSKVSTTYQASFLDVSHILDVCSELIVLTFEYLEMKDIAFCEQTCTFFRQLVMKHMPVQKLLSWLLCNGAKFPKTVAKGRRIYCKELMAEHDEVCVIPEQCMMKASEASQSELCSKLDKASQEKGMEFPSRAHIFLAITLLYERSLGTKSKWHYYINALPAKLDTLPIFYSEQLIQDELKGSLTIKKIDDRLRALKRDYVTVSTLLGFFDSNATFKLTGRAISSLETIPRNGNIDYFEFSFEEFVWARYIVMSRIYGIKTPEHDSVLVPFADLLYHKGRKDKVTKWGFDRDQNAFVMKAIKAITPGQQIFNSFGEKCNSRFFVNYGFIVEHNETKNEARVVVNLDKVIDAHGWQARYHHARDTWDFSRTKVYFYDVGLNLCLEMYFSDNMGIHTFNLGVLRYLLTTSDTNTSMPSDGMYDSGFEVISKGSNQSTYRLPRDLKIEKKLLTILSHAFESSIEEFPHTLEQDLKILHTNTHKRRSNMWNIVQMRKGEKVILHHWLEFCKLGLGLISGKDIDPSAAALSNAGRYLSVLRSLCLTDCRKSYDPALNRLYECA